MTTEFPLLFSPININHVEIKNRIAYPALGLIYSYDRKLNDKYLNFYKARAEGGAGIVTVGPVGVDFRGAGIGFLTIDNDDAIDSFRELTSLIRQGGARSWIQLFHAGAYTHPFLINGRQPLAPSAVYSPYSKTTPKAMTVYDIETVIGNFATAAQRAKRAGFDGVEIIGSAGYLICQFLSPKTNQRTDAYGGSLDNRLKFPLDLIARVRNAVGKDYPVTIRMAGNDFVDGSNDSTQTPVIAAAYERAGIDAINVTGGWHETRVPQLPSVLPGSGFAYLALGIRRAVSIPVMASNRISSPDAAEAVIRDGFADMVNLGRVLLADPEWPLKALEGRKEEIRPCVACSQGCTDEVFSGRPVFCIGNPETGFEKERRLKKTDSPKKILIAGAGPGGLEAAVTAAALGHSVEIFEKSGVIGGQIPLAAAPPHKHEFLEFIRYYKAMLKKYAIPCHFNTEVGIDLIKQKEPDHVIVATGALQRPLDIPGFQDSLVIPAWDFLRNDAFLGKRTAVIGGGAVGLETALLAASKGTLAPDSLHFLFSYDAETPERLKSLVYQGSVEVTVLEILSKVGTDVGKSTRWVLLDALKRYGVNVITQAEITRFENGVLYYRYKDQEKTLPVDSVILAAGVIPENRLIKSLEGTDIPFTAVGDCNGPGNLGASIHGGFLAVMKL